MNNMKRYLFILLAAAALCSCDHSSEPTPVMIDFTYDRLSPYMVQFTNYSHGCDSYRWDFGDGAYSYDKDATYTYSSLGTYTVSLTGTADGQKHIIQQTIRLTAPHVFFAGYTLYSIPYENRYYKLVFKDDNLLPSSWDFFTIYSPLLDNSYLPYTKIWSNPQELTNLDSHSYYTVEVIRTIDASSTANDVSCMKKKLMVKDIKTYQPTYILQTETGATVVGIEMYYEY